MDRLLDDEKILELFKLAATNKQKLNQEIQALIDVIDARNKQKEQEAQNELERRIRKRERKEARFKEGVDLLGNKIKQAGVK